MRAWLVIFAGLFASIASAATIYSIDHEDALRGQVSGIDAQERVLFTAEGSETTVGVRMDGIREIEFGRNVRIPAKEDARFRMVFLDGSILFGDLLSFEDPDEALDYLKVKTLTQGEIKIRNSGLQRIERREDSKPDADPYFNKEERKNLKPGLGWRLYKARGGSEFACSLLASYPNKIEYEISVDLPELSMIWSEIRSIVRAPSDEAPFDKLYGVFTTRRGERFVGRVKKWSKGEIELDTPYFGKVKLKESNLSNSIFRNGRFTFLSDMEVKEAKEYPYMRSKDFKSKDHLFPYRLDRAQGGAAISLKGKVYAKGIGVHAISRLTYDLKGRYGRFMATIGVDDSAGKMASVVFRVFADGKEVKFKLTPIEGKGDKAPETIEKLSSGVIRKGTTPMRIEVDVKNAEEMTIVVEAADKADIHDRANWANAMLVR